MLEGIEGMAFFEHALITQMFRSRPFGGDDFGVDTGSNLEASDSFHQSVDVGSCHFVW